MSQFPEIETERFVHSVDIFKYFSLDEVTRFYDVESFTNIKQAEELIQRWNERFERNQAIRWGITLRSLNRVIGTMWISWLDEKSL